MGGLLLPFLLWSSDSCYLRRNGADKWMFHNAANGIPCICKERETFHKGSAGAPWTVTRCQFSLGSCLPADSCRETHSSRCCCPHRQQEHAARSWSCVAPRTLRFQVIPKHCECIEFMGAVCRHGTRQFRFCSNLLDLACPMVRPRSGAYPYLKTDAWVAQRRSLMAQSASISWRPGTEHNYAAMDNANDLSAGSRAMM